jgi:hypothetical protein
LLHEVLEAFLMEKVYPRALTPTPESARQDEALHLRLKSLGFVTFRHLDLPIPRSKEAERAWEQLVEQLQSLVLFVSPRRKMDCVLRICQDLTTLLSSQHPTGRLPSADEFLPGLIFLLLRANPRELKRNVNFILEYRSPSKLVSEPGYFFTHLVSSVAFLEEVNGSLLTISPEEFEDGLRRSKQAMVKEIQTASSHGNSASSRSTSSGSPSSGQSRETLQQKLDHGDVLVNGEAPHVPDILELRAKRVALWEQLDR